MQRVLDIFQLLVYLGAIALMIAVGSSTLATLDAIRTDIKQGQVKHDQMLRDHQKFMEKY